MPVPISALRRFVGMPDGGVQDSELGITGASRCGKLGDLESVGVWGDLNFVVGGGGLGV